MTIAALMTFLPASIPSFLTSPAGMTLPALVNHLWQSTLFAAVTGMIILVLKDNHPRVRYWLWLAASMKFLLPFALLMEAGQRLQWMKSASPEFSILVRWVNQPFTSAHPNQIPVSADTAMLSVVWRMVPAFLLVVWAAGSAALLLFWFIRWRRVAVMAAMPGTPPMESGREIEMLRRLEGRIGINRQIALVVSAAALEPGILGIFRPILLLPTGIADRLTDAQMEAVIMHELCHVRRHDNLTAALHMLAEAVFWFHPLIWWIGSRLIEERELACDEEVLRLGSEPRVYAEGILKVCEFCLESPLICVAGVTGPSLKKRMEKIMVHRNALKLSFGRKLLLAALGTLTITGPLCIGLMTSVAGQAQSSSIADFESVSIVPKGPASGIVQSRIVQHMGVSDFTNTSLTELIKFAYRLNDLQISGAPRWASSDLYDVSLKARGSVTDDQFRLELQTVLADRFRLAAHREIQQRQVYEMVVANSGLKLTETHPEKDVYGGINFNPGHASGKNIQIPMLADFLAARVGLPVLDKTNLSGNYNFTLDWPDTGMPADSLNSLVKAVPTQLGLDLNAQTVSMQVLILDHAEPITKN